MCDPDPQECALPYRIEKREWDGGALIDVFLPVRYVLATLLSIAALFALGGLVAYPFLLLLTKRGAPLAGLEELRFLMAVLVGNPLGVLMIRLRAYFRTRRWRRLLKKYVDPAHDKDSNTLVSIMELLARHRAGRLGGEFPLTHARRLAEYLKAIGRSGVAVRVSTDLGGKGNTEYLDTQGKHELDPFPFAFEPTRLSDTAALYGQQETSGKGKPRRRLHRWVFSLCVAGGVFGLLVFSDWLIFNGSDLGYFVMGILAVAAMAAVLTFLVYAGGILWSRLARSLDGGWWLVPGGIVQRRSGWMGGPMELNLYTRDTTNMIVVPGANVVLFTREDGSPVNLPCNLKHQIALLNAWFCPATPPTHEQLSDLREG